MMMVSHADDNDGSCHGDDVNDSQGDDDDDDDDYGGEEDDDCGDNEKKITKNTPVHIGSAIALSTFIISVNFQTFKDFAKLLVATFLFVGCVIICDSLLDMLPWPVGCFGLTRIHM